MKKSILFLAFIFVGLSTFSQEECKDIIYTQEGNRIIFNCCIQEVIKRNTVIYTKDGVLSRIAATAITMDGEYIELTEVTDVGKDETYPVEEGKYRGRDYKYYEEKFVGARTRQIFGILFTFAGLGCEIAGIVIANKEYLTNQEADKAVGLILVGGLLENLGIPLWISGGIKKANNRAAMDAIKRSNNLSLGISPYGIGLTYKF